MIAFHPRGLYMSNKPYISIIIPVHNEEENILELYERLYRPLSLIEKTYEIIFIDDGSTDNTFEKIESIKDCKVKVVRFQRNYGKAAALSCGFKKSKGDIVITLDGDLQDDPKEIPRFIDELKNMTWFPAGKAKGKILFLKLYLQGSLTG